MRYTTIEPPRRFSVGRTGSIELSDCARLSLAPNEQVTFETPSGTEYDVVRTFWGYYATPSLNDRLPRFNLRGVLVENPQGRRYLLLVERDHEREFDAYCASEQLSIITWLDDPASVHQLRNPVTIGVETIGTPDCPCGMRRLELIHDFTAPPPQETRFESPLPYRRRLERCTACGHFVSTSHLSIEELYASQYVDATYGRDGLRAAFDRIMALPRNQSDNVGRVRYVCAVADRLGIDNRDPDDPVSVLDVGSGLGVFPAALRADTHAADWRITALDPDPHACHHIQGAADVSVLCHDFLAYAPEAPFDIITINKVLEHVFNPIAMLRHAKQCVSKRGFVYVEVPDAGTAIQHGIDREEFFIEHLHGFTTSSLSRAAERAGLRVVEITALQEPSTKYTLRALLVWPGGPPV